MHNFLIDISKMYGSVRVPNPSVKSLLLEDHSPSPMSAEIGTLSHLVEAATALANLDSSSPGASYGKAESKVQFTSDASGVNVNSGKKQPNLAEDASMQRNKREIFPQRMLAVLNEPPLSDIISWLPHGRSFVIIRPDVFTEKVMPKYFPPVDARGSTKYPSFTRKLNRWGFRQATRGPDTGAFHHPLFQRDHPDLCVDMVCQRSRAVGGAKTKQQKQPQTAVASQVKVATLTKESLETILPSSQATEIGKTATTVSLDETRSVTSNTSGGSVATSTSSISMVGLRQGVSTDKVFVDMAIRQRDEMERLRVAQALLFKAFTSAVRHQSHD